ncbi:uncharacterized protein LOC131227036 [Magnolia sinica]|uniref:uncharacterized protein LOC131227036 n=1 Tax=Magnolia sinica TaxID=86752 RepID=UPI00265AA0DF|nr:uncharacterized protein LOC131227036 [Magnolia sinica]
MRSDTPLDYAVFQLSPRRSRCELFVSGEGKTEKLASGLLKPFVTHLRVAEEQVAQAVQSIKLEVEKRRNAGTWFTKGTLERFVRFVSTPEVLELVNTYDAEMSQLEAARRIYSQGSGDQLSGLSGESETVVAGSADITKHELLRAIDVRLIAVKQDLTTACARASAAGFTLDNVSELLLFADRFGAYRLNEASSKFISLCQRRPELINPWKPDVDDRAVRSSSGSDMSIDDPAAEESAHLKPNGPHQQAQHQHQPSRQEEDATQLHDPSKHSTWPLKFSSSVSLPSHRSSSRETSVDRVEGRERDGPTEKPAEDAAEPAPSLASQQPTRRLSVQDRINLFENKQKEQQSGSGSGSGSGSKVAVVGKGPELRRLSSDVSSSSAGPSAAEKAVLRRWSGASDMSVELSGERKETAESSTVAAASHSSNSQSQKDLGGLKDTVTSQLWSGLKEDSDASQTTQSRAFPGRVGEDTALKEEAAHRSKFGTFTGRVEDGGLKDRAASAIQLRAFLGKGEDALLKDQAAPQTQSRTFSGGTEHVGLKDQGLSQTQFRALQSGSEHVGTKVQVATETQFRSFPVRVEDVGLKDSASQAQFRALPSRVDDVGSKGSEASQMPSRAFLSRVEDVGLKDQPASQIQTSAFPSKPQEVGSKLKDPVSSQIPFKAFLGKAEGIGSKDLTGGSQAPYRGFAGKAEEVGRSEPLAPQSHWRSFPGKADEVGKKDLASSQAQFGAPFPTKVEESGGRDSGFQGMKLHRQGSGPEQSKKFQGKKDGIMPAYGNGELAFSGRKVTENQQMFDLAANASVEPVQKVRQSKGNQELNDELQMKADELEKLFAAHKLRVPGDQTASSRRSKLADPQVEQVTSVTDKKPVEVTPNQLSEKNQAREPSGSSSNGLEFDFSSLMKMVNNRDSGNSSKQQLAELSSSEDSRGKFYERYMQKRDAKLREEWGSKRAQKEAKMKAMHDSLERSRAEMKANFAGSVDRQDAALSARRRAEKLRSFNVRTSIKNKEQVAEPFQSDEEEDLPEFSEQTPYGHDSSFNETLFSDGSSRSTHSKKLLPNRTVPSSTPRTSVAPVPRSSVKGTNSASGRRRIQGENPLAQSVPNFSDFRKENTKPSTGISKTSNRSQSRNYARSKSTSEDVSLVKEEKPRRSQSLRKSSANSGELKDVSPVNSDGVVLTPLRFSKEQTEQSLYTKIPKSGESKPFLRKGDGIGPGSGVGIAKLKASMASENMKNGEDSEELVDHTEDSPDTVKEEDEEEFERASGEENLKMGDFPADSDNEKPRLSQESEKSGYPGSENGEVLRSLSQVDDNSVSAMAAISSNFNASAGTAQDSPGESPASWNSRTHHSFSYTQDALDVDAFADSPIGSPASWNSHSLSQMMEADAARMRKKWGSAQIPILVANTSHQSRKDVTKGFKRLLKFGRKSRGAESLITDWVSASTTSEGDDDTEDGRDLANRSSEDLRKTRMGFSQSHSSYDGFNEGEIFHEQDQTLRSSIPAPPANFKLREDHLSGSSLKAPRSFFSLSSFRSKGSESKPR